MLFNSIIISLHHQTREQNIRNIMKTRVLFRKDVAIQAILYVAHAIGERKDIHKICKTLYYADQMHLSKYGRSITGDVYIAMNYGPVPSNIEDIFKAMRGDSYFSDQVDDIKEYFYFVNKYILKTKKEPDMDFLSDSDVECLDSAILKCKDKSFKELTIMSHDLAWENTQKDRVMSVKDILREIGDDEDYVNYIDSQVQLARSFK